MSDIPSSPPVLLWFRQDLRLDDNLALMRAAEAGGAMIPVFLWSPEEEGPWPPGAASRWWLHHSLRALEEGLGKINLRLILRKGPSLSSLRELAGQTGAKTVVWQRRHEPAARARDARTAAALAQADLNAIEVPGALLFEPEKIFNSQGKPYQVFTPFYRSRLAGPEPAAPLPRPVRLPAPEKWPESLKIEDLALLPRINWAEGIRAAWTPGEAGARRRLERFIQCAAEDYSAGRDRPDLPGVSRLSPHLHFGEISPRRIWHEVRSAFPLSCKSAASASEGPGAFLRQIVWREFAYYLLYHYPHTAEEPLRPEFSRFPWREDDAGFAAWKKGRTGFPYIDAAMRELWATGWMHNRPRMAVASFLVKDLLIPWRAGAEWFWDTLVDADLANNTLGWQWTAGCGADASPFFRVFNPVSQGEKFDPEGRYVRRWVPELSGLSNSWIHKPWLAPAHELKRAGMAPGGNYPRPIWDHAQARDRALAAFRSIR